MDINYQNMQMNLLGPYIYAPEVLKERNQVAAYYNFFDGKTNITNEFMDDINKGQSWRVNSSLDYVPSQDIRNHTKRLIKKQARFMFGVTPNLLFKSLNKKDKAAKEKAEGLRKFIDTILDDNEFWKDTFKAFLDCTIGKRMLLRIEANPKEPIGIYYHVMDEFTFEVDKSDYKRLTQVIIAYMDKESTIKQLKEQKWYRWKYYFENGKCMLQQGTYDGFGNAIEETISDTELDEIPCKVIINGGLTGDITGTSDVKDLIDLQNAYNHTTSDYRDALRFKMFEQPVFIDADPETTEDIKIAPNAIIDLKSDPSIDGAKADAKMLSSSFSFVEGAKSFLDGTKSDMYELMDMPRPDDVKTVPSAKALRFTFFDLISRCEEKWQEWESAFKWLVKMIIKCTNQFRLYPEKWDNAWNNLEYKIVIKHNYPVPEDTAENKTAAIEEVTANVRSVKAYLKEFSDEEDIDSEYDEILKEVEELANATKDTLSGDINSEIEGMNGGSSSADDGSKATGKEDITGEKEKEPNKGEGDK